MSVFGNKLSGYVEQTLIHEAYIGKTPTLELIEQKIKAIQDAGPLSIYQNMSRDKRILEINRLFEKQFGMYLFSLNIDNTEYIDAYSYSLSKRIDIARKYSPDQLNKLVKADSNGYRFVPGNELCITVYISVGLLFNAGLSAGEVVAVLLHEIGHNFSNCLYGKLWLANREMMLEYRKNLITQSLIGILLVPFGYGIKVLKNVKKEYDIVSNKGQSNKAIDNEVFAGKTRGLRAIINGLKTKYDDYYAYIDELKLRLSDWAKYKVLKLNPKKDEKYKEAKSGINRLDEVFADKFAAVYGYGPQLSSGLAIMDDWLSRANKQIQSTGTDKEKQNNLKFEEIQMRALLYDCHPQTVQRIIENIKLLRRELEKDKIDPKLKAVIEGQLKDMEDLLKKITVEFKELSENDNARRIWNAYINNELPDAVNNKIEEEIEKALDSKIEEFNKKEENKK